MALTFTQENFDTRTLAAIDIGTDEWILESQLTPQDKVHLEAALAEATLDAYTMPNGMDAQTYFDIYTRSAAEISAGIARNRIRRGQVGVVATLETQVADHEARITTLEP